MYFHCSYMDETTDVLCVFCIVLCFICLSLFCVLCPMLSVFLDCSFFVVPLIFPNVYVDCTLQMKTNSMHGMTCQKGFFFTIQTNLLNERLTFQSVGIP